MKKAKDLPKVDMGFFLYEASCGMHDRYFYGQAAVFSVSYPRRNVKI
jgi:hypothetical protein